MSKQGLTKPFTSHLCAGHLRAPSLYTVSSGAGSRAGSLSKCRVCFYSVWSCLFVCLTILTILTRFLPSSFRSFILGRSLSLSQSSPALVMSSIPKFWRQLMGQLHNIEQCFGCVVGMEAEPWEGLCFLAFIPCRPL